MKPFNYDAVSPVVGVMLMIVVTIIIAAVVSAFAGGAIGNTQKTPQANIKGMFSVSGGMQIIHAGGDSIPTQDLVFEMTHDPSFGAGIDALTTTIINRSLIQDLNNNYLINPTTGISTVDPNFKAGDSLLISTRNCNCYDLQQQVGPDDYGPPNINGYPGDYNNLKGMKINFWNMCFRNTNSIGRTFILTTLDKRTNGVVSRNTVTINP
jgi:archaeal type IV pilus assembly protein PilA